MPLMDIPQTVVLTCDRCSDTEHPETITVTQPGQVPPEGWGILVTGGNGSSIGIEQLAICPECMAVMTRIPLQPVGKHVHGS